MIQDSGHSSLALLLHERLLVWTLTRQSHVILLGCMLTSGPCTAGSSYSACISAAGHVPDNQPEVRQRVHAGVLAHHVLQQVCTDRCACRPFQWDLSWYALCARERSDCI